MTDPCKERVETIRKLIGVFKPIVDDLCKLSWKASDGFWYLTCRCVLRRQYDAMAVIANLAQRDEGHSSVPLLRPACEEYLWIKYLRTIDSMMRETIVKAKMAIEVDDCVAAQRKYAGDDVMNQFGFTAAVMEQISKHKLTAQGQLTSVQKALKWPQTRGSLPSVRFIAQAAGEADLYDLIYHATSRAVHFTVSELMRRAWGNEKLVTISSDQMGEYWSDFSLYWGWRIFYYSFYEIALEFESAGVPVKDFEDEKLFDSLIKQYVDPGQMPIITPEELNLHVPPEKLEFFLNL